MEYGGLPLDPGERAGYIVARLRLDGGKRADTEHRAALLARRYGPGEVSGSMTADALREHRAQLLVDMESWRSRLGPGFQCAEVTRLYWRALAEVDRQLVRLGTL